MQFEPRPLLFRKEVDHMKSLTDKVKSAMAQGTMKTLKDALKG